MINPEDIVVRQQLAIRKPVSEVFDAFANPQTTTKFWFNRSSGPLRQGATVTWFWDLYDAAAAVEVLAFEPEARLLLAWGTPGADRSDSTSIELLFEATGDDRTRVTIVNRGFKGDERAVLDTALDSMGGFSLVLAAAKAWLEHGIDLRVVEDKT